MKTGALERVLVRPPHADDIPSWRQLGWRAEPDAAGLAAEHDALCAILEDAGAKVVRADGKRGSLDAIYAFDPLLLTVRARCFSAPESRSAATSRRRCCRTSSAPAFPSPAASPSRHSSRAATRSGSTTARSSSAARTARTPRESKRCVRHSPAVDVIAVDLPHLNGRGEVLHLLSLLSPLDDDLVVGYPPLMPVPLVELLEERGIEIVVVPAEEFETKARTSSRSRPASGSRLEGQRHDPRRGSPTPASRCSSTAATRSRARATAARPVSPSHWLRR